MIITISVIFIFIGIMLMSADIFMAIPPGLEVIFFMNRTTGMVFAIVGAAILLARISSTGVGSIIDLPNSNKVILFHQRRGKNPNTTIMPAKLRDLEFIKAKNKLFVDTGGGFRIAGHDCRRTHEMICADIPDWLSQYFHDMKKKFGIDNIEVWRQFRRELKTIVPNREVEEYDPATQAKATKKLSVEEQLKRITILKEGMEDPRIKEYLLSVDWQDLHLLESYFFDGTTHHAEDVERWIESATPNELDALEKQQYLNDSMRDKNYSEPGEINWGKWVPVFGFLLLCGAIAAVMIQGAFG